MKFLFCVYILYLSHFPCCQTAKMQVRYGIESIKVVCEHDSTIARDVVCTLVKLSPSNASLSVEGAFVGEAHSLIMRMEYFYKTGKRYVANSFKGNVDVCDFAKGSDGFFVKNLFPDVRDWIGDVIHPCPYSGSFSLKDYIVDGSFVARFLKAGSYRFDYRLYNTDNLTFFYLKYFANINKIKITTPEELN